MWQAEADTELTLSASPTTAVGQKALSLAKRRYSGKNLLYLDNYTTDAYVTYEADKSVSRRSFHPFLKSGFSYFCIQMEIHLIEQ